MIIDGVVGLWTSGGIKKLMKKMTKTVYFEYVLSGPWRKDLNQT
jgi:hypothetical protein